MNQIRFTAVSAVLAQTLYYARAEAYNLQVAIWEALVPSEKRQWVEKAQIVLDSMRPIARDTPGPLLFAFAASVARQEQLGKKVVAMPMLTTDEGAA
jgi:hypothetical protein